MIVLLGAEKREEITIGEVERFISQLENLPILVDTLTAPQSFRNAHGISWAIGAEFLFAFKA